VIHRPILSIGPSVPVNGSIKFQALQPETNLPGNQQLEYQYLENRQLEHLELGCVHLPLAGWYAQQRHDHNIVWIKGPKQLRQLELIPGDAGFTQITAENVTCFRRAGRQVALDQGMGLIELDCIRVAARAALRIICKQPLEDSAGFMYSGRLIVPFPKFTISLATQSLELEHVGWREQAIEARMRDRNSSEPQRRIRDPYDPAFDSSASFHIADDRGFDAQFPDHPLSLVRQDLRILETGITFSDQPADAWIEHHFD
jgi:hypothetical protein